MPILPFSILPNRRRLGNAVLCAAALSLACGEESPGTVTIAYLLGYSNDCAEFGAVEVEAVIGDGDFDDTVECGRDITFATIPAGTWSLAVDAYDAEGYVILDNGGDPESARVRVPEGGDAEITAQLSATPVELRVRWALNAGDFQAQCSDERVATKRFRATAWDRDGAMLLRQEFACDAMADNTGYHLLEDPDRLVKGSSLRAVTIDPLDASGGLVGAEPVRFEFDAPGAGRKLYFTLACNDNVCVAQGMAPYDMP